MIGLGVRYWFVCFAIGASFCLAAPATAGPIDLTDTAIFADDDGFGSTGAVDVDSPSAGKVTINEFVIFGISLFSPWVNDPTNLGHTQIISPGDVVAFNYDFTIGAGTNDDEFVARVFDPSDGSTVGTHIFTRSATEAGSHSFDMTALVAPAVLGLEFSLNPDFFNDNALTSTVVISNLVVNPTTQPIPEPGTFALFGAAAVAAYVVRRRRKLS